MFLFENLTVTESLHHCFVYFLVCHTYHSCFYFMLLPESLTPCLVLLNTSYKPLALRPLISPANRCPPTESSPVISGMNKATTPIITPTITLTNGISFSGTFVLVLTSSTIASVSNPMTPEYTIISSIYIPPTYLIRTVSGIQLYRIYRI